MAMSFKSSKILDIDSCPVAKSILQAISNALLVYLVLLIHKTLFIFTDALKQHEDNILNDDKDDD